LQALEKAEARAAGGERGKKPAAVAKIADSQRQKARERITFKLETLDPEHESAQMLREVPAEQRAARAEEHCYSNCRQVYS
jgi:hypothetical protein